MKTCTDCFPNFGKTLTESTNIFIDTGEHLADGNIHHKAKGHRLIARRGSPNSYKVIYEHGLHGLKGSGYLIYQEFENLRIFFLTTDLTDYV